MTCKLSVIAVAGLFIFPACVLAQGGPQYPQYPQANSNLQQNEQYIQSYQNPQYQYNPYNPADQNYIQDAQGSGYGNLNLQNQGPQVPTSAGTFNYSYNFQGLGTPGNLGTPGKLGSPGGLGTPGSGIVPEGGVVPDFTPKALTPRTLTSHLLVERPGVGDQCKAGITAPGSWEIGMSDPLATKDDLVRVVETATANDTRLRSVRIYDDRIDMYYLQPAYVWGFIPSNYLLHVTANGNTLRISLDKPKWATKAQNQHAQVSAAFSMYVPQYLNDHVVDQLEVQDLIARDAKMVEVI